MAFVRSADCPALQGEDVDGRLVLVSRTGKGSGVGLLVGGCVLAAEDFLEAMTAFMVSDFDKHRRWVSWGSFGEHCVLHLAV